MLNKPRPNPYQSHNTTLPDFQKGFPPSVDHTKQESKWYFGLVWDIIRPMSDNNLANIKSAVIKMIDTEKGSLEELSLKLHANPELGYQEYKAVEWLCEYLSRHNFSIEKNLGGLKTAFKATFGQGKPVVGFLAEYDALPQLGHACGHNLIATSAASAVIAARMAAKLYGGTVCLIGTPAEELSGGKIQMVEKGIFKELDAALIAHPGNDDIATTQALACVTLNVEYFGKESHAAAHPDKGINALDAIVLAYTSLNSLRQHIEPGARIHGIITDGGKAANIVPGHSAGTFLIRSQTMPYLKELMDRVLDCFKSAAQATGARLEYHFDKSIYAPMNNNITLANLYVTNMDMLGRKTLLEDPEMNFGSTDMGNVSQIVPSLHGYYSITRKEVSGHTEEFASAACSSKGIKGALDAAKAMAMTAADLLGNPANLDKVRTEFQKSTRPSA
ncbi:peptidase, M20 family [Dehalococcoides mccartyi GY50]|nr:peptidase, M20 family [Dehalococcoides mccartyi GY50]